MNPVAQSSLFEGSVRHRRHVDGAHAFRYRIGLVLVDLDETERMPTGMLRSYRRSDYLGDSQRPLKACVMEKVQEALDFTPRGPVRMLTQLRSFGYMFNPVTFYLCHAEDGALEAVVAEITNTPWRERFAYVLDARSQSDRSTMRWSFDKAFHVSPFHGMDHVYRWSLQYDGDRLAVSMVNFRHGKRQFDATLVGSLTPFTRKALRRQALRSPLQAQRMHFAIYVHALRLFLKRARFHVHPRKRVQTLSPEEENHEPAIEHRS